MGYRYSLILAIRVAVIDGIEHAPGQPWKYGKQSVSTLWSELAWQLGGEESGDAMRGVALFAMVTSAPRTIPQIEQTFYIRAKAA